MRDITLEETLYFNFTTRAFGTGIPTQLGGSPALSVLESNNATPITAGVSVSVDRASVTGLNQATVVATAANGYEAGKSYAVYISTGTVGGVSVVGEVVAEFTAQASAAFTRLGAPAGASVSADVAAAKADTAAIKTKTDGLTFTVANVLDANTLRVGGTVQTARDIGSSVLLSSGTGTGQLKLASGYVAMTWADIAAPTTTVNLSGTTVKTATDVETDTQDIQARLPAALTAGGNMKADALALSGDTTAADNAESFFDGTGYAGTNNVIPLVTAVTTVNGLAANSITAAAAAADFGAEVADAVWDEALSGHATGGSAGAALSAATAPSAADVADAVWDELLSGHVVSGSTGEALTASGGAGDPWITAVPGAYSAGQAGYILGTNLNATVSSRATQTSVDDVPTNAELATALGTADDAVLAQVALVKAKTDLIPASPAAVSDIPTAVQNADALLNRDMATGTDSGSPTVRTPRQAFRFLRNKWSISGTTLTVTKEDDTTASWTSTVATTPGADPVTGNDPA